MSDAKENVFELAVDKLREALNYELACDGARRILRNVFVPRLALVHRRMFGTPYTELTVELLETQCRRYAIALGISNPQRQPEPVLSNEQLQRALLNLPVTTWIYYHALMICVKIFTRLHKTAKEKIPDAYSSVLAVPWRVRQRIEQIERVNYGPDKLTCLENETLTMLTTTKSVLQNRVLLFDSRMSTFMQTWQSDVQLDDSVSDWNSATARRLWECWDKRDENTQRQWEAEFLRALTTHLPAAVITSDVNREIAFALMSVVTTGVARPSDCFDAPDVSVVRSSSPSGVHQCLREKKTECYVTRNKTGEQKRDTSESFGVKEGRSVTEQKTERADIRLNQSVRVAPTIETCTDEDEIDSKDDVENGELQLPEENKAEGREEEANEKENEESENAEEDKGKGSDKIPSDSESEEDREGTMFGGRKVTTTTSTKYGDMQVTTTVWPAFSGDNIPPQVKRLLYKVRRKLPSSLASRFNTIASYREMHPYYREMHPYYREDVAYDDDDDDDSDDERNVREAKRYRGRGAGIRFGFGIDVGKRTASFISNAKKGDAIKSESKVRKKSMVTLSLERLDRKEADLRHAETSPSSPPPVPPIIRATVQPKLSVTSKDGGAAKKRKSAMQIQRAPQLVTSARTVLGDYAVPFSFVPISDGGNTNVLSDSGTNVLSDSSNTNVLSGSDNLPDTTQTFLHLSDLRVASPPSPPPSPPQSPNHSVIKSPVPNEPSKSPSPLVQMESSTQPSTTSYLPSHPNATPSTKEVKIAHAKIAVKDVSEVLLKLKLEREAELKVALCKHEEMVRAAEPIVCKYRECRQRSKTIGDTERAYEAECTNACRLIYHVGCWKSLVRDRTLRRDAPCLADKCAGTLVYAATTDKLHIFVARIKTRAGANLGLSHPRLASERSTNSFLPSPPSPSSTDFSTARGSSDNDVRTLRVSESRTKALGRKTARTEPKLAKSECKNATPEAGNANPHDKTIKPRIETINLGIRIAKPESATAKLETEPVKARTKTVKPEAQIAKSETKPAKPSSSASVLASLSSTRQRPAPATTSSSPTIKSESKASTSIPRFRMCDIRPNNSILKPVSQSPTSKAQYPTSARNTTVSMSQCGRGTDEPHAIVATRVTALSRKRSSRHASHNSCNEECDVDIGIEASNGPEIVSSRVFTVCDSPAPMTTLSLSVSDLVPPKRPITRVNAPTSYPHVSPPTQTARIALSTTPTSRPGTIGANACVTDARALSKEVVCVNSKVNASKIQDIEMNSMFVSTRAAQATEIKSFGSHPVTKTLDVVPIFPYHASSAIFSNLPAQRSCVDSLQRDCITSPQSACVTALQKGCATGRTPATSVFVASKNRQRLSTTLNPCLAPVSEITIAAPVHRKTMLPRPRAIGTMLSRPRAIGPSRTAIISPRPLTVITAHHPMTNLGTDTTVTSCQKIRSCYQSAPLCATLSRPHVEPRSPYYHSFPLSQITTPTPFLFSPSIATNATTSSAAYNSPKDEMFIDAVTKRQHWIEISTIPTNMLCLYPLAPDVTTTQLGTYFGSQQWVRIHKRIRTADNMWMVVIVFENEEIATIIKNTVEVHPHTDICRNWFTRIEYVATPVIIYRDTTPPSHVQTLPPVQATPFPTSRSKDCTHSLYSDLSFLESKTSLATHSKTSWNVFTELETPFEYPVFTEMMRRLAWIRELYDCAHIPSHDDPDLGPD